MATCLKSLLLAIQQYRDNRTAQNAAQLRKQVEVSKLTLVGAVCNSFRMLNLFLHENMESTSGATGLILRCFKTAWQRRRFGLRLGKWKDGIDRISGGGR